MDIRRSLLPGALLVVSFVVTVGCQMGSCARDDVSSAGQVDSGEAASGDDESAESSEPAPDHPIQAAKSFYNSRPHFQQPLAETEVPEGLPDLSAETCGSCHEAIYKEWKVSTHRRAWTDPQFQAELHKSRGRNKDGSAKKRDDVGWMCVNCHTPLMNQMERLTVGLEDGNIGKPKYVDNPNFEEGLKDEGITCAGCHVRDGKVYGPWGDTNAPHPTAKKEKLESEKACTQCHQAEAKWPSRNLACFFTTGEEWKRSKYGQRDQTCQSCHMPEVERPLVPGGKERTTRRHWFGGSLIPKRPEYEGELEPLREVYGSGAKIEVLPGTAPPTREEDRDAGSDDQKPGLLEASSCPDEAEACRYFRIRATNAYAGHGLPTGDPERHIDIRGEVEGDGEDGPVTVVEQRIGSKYKWWPEIVLQYDNRLEPEDHLDTRIAVPESELPATLEVVARKYRMYTGAYEHHDLEGKYVRGRKFHTSTWRLTAGGEPELETIADDFGERTQLLPEEKRGDTANPH
jgi:hypothetical protein